MEIMEVSQHTNERTYPNYFLKFLVRRLQRGVTSMGSLPCEIHASYPRAGAFTSTQHPFHRLGVGVVTGCSIRTAYFSVMVMAWGLL